MARMVLFDTNVVSYVFKNYPFAALYREHLGHTTPCLALITLAELYCWAELRDWGKDRIRQLESHLEAYLLLPQRREIASCYARVVTHRRSVGRPLSVEDALIAATAIVYDIPLVTHNRKDFEQIPDLHIISEAP
jgi:predicted nucleic acid-binding protein